MGARWGGLASNFGEQASGSSDRSSALWGQQGDLYGQIGAKLFGGEFDDPGQAARAVDYGRNPEFQKWWENMRGGAGTTALTDASGKPIADYSSIASGTSKYYSPEEEYAMRERPASQARSATSAMLDQARRGGVSGWGAGGPAAGLAAQKNLLSSLRSGNLDVNAMLGDKGAEYRKYGRAGMESSQGQMQGLEDKMASERAAAAATARAGRKAGLNEYLSYLNADPRGSALDWSQQTTSNLGGQGSALSGWGNATATQGGGPSTGSKILGGVGKAAAIAGPIIIAL
jgi:hypothetical protein